MKINTGLAHNFVIVHNHNADPNYAPYCGRCPGLVRMSVVEPFLFKHSCGAVHDERQVICDDGEDQSSPALRRGHDIRSDQGDRGVGAGLLPRQHGEVHQPGGEEGRHPSGSQEGGMVSRPRDLETGEGE